MNPPVSFVRRDADITNALGLHMRPADKFVRVAQQFRAEIRVRYAGKEANGKSLLDLMTLAAGCGSRLSLEARGEDATAALAALADLVSGWSDEAEGCRGELGTRIDRPERAPDGGSRGPEPRRHGPEFSKRRAP